MRRPIIAFFWDVTQPPDPVSTFVEYHSSHHHNMLSCKHLSNSPRSPEIERSTRSPSATRQWLPGTS